MTILTTLKQSTWPYHKRLEAKLDWFMPGFSREDYRLMLEKFWGYYSPLEARFASFPALAGWLPDLPRRAKLPLLETDLRALGLDSGLLERIPPCRELPACSDAVEALGCLYVLEGSTLGGQVISWHLRRLLDIDAGNGAAFFNGYADDTGFMWRVFGEGLTAAQADAEVLVRSACETFMTLEEWLCPS